MAIRTGVWPANWIAPTTGIDADIRAQDRLERVLEAKWQGTGTRA